MVIAFVLALLLARAAQGATSDVSEKIAKIEARAGVHIGVAALDVGKNKRIEHRPNERFLMCSTFKFLAAAAVLKRADDKMDDLNRFVRYGEKDILEYAPVTKQHLAEGGMKLDDLCAAAIEQSDNTAGNLLLKTIGDPAALTAFARTLGDKVTRLDRTEPELNVGAPGDERDTSSPVAMVEDMRLLLTGDALSASSRQKLEEWLSKNQTGNSMIRAAVPKTWMVGDKTGRSRHNVNDIAIIRPPNRGPILVVIFSVGSSAETEMHDDTIAEVARIILETL